ncbi:MAG: RNA polymerase sigma factor [Gammaproteobacteria bacterium]
MTTERCAALASLAQAASTGNPDAIARLLAACQPDARRYARRHCAASDVDDAVQEALLTVAHKAGAIRVAAAFTSWLFVVIQRECLRLARMFGRGSATVSLADGDDGLAGHRHDALAQLETRSDDALRLDLIAALESLPAHYREVVLLRDFAELSISDIAQQLGEPDGAVKSRLHRARALVRDYLTSDASPAGAVRAPERAA